MKTTVEMQWVLCLKCGRHICLATYASNVKCMYTNVLGHIIDCNEFI